MPEPYEIDDPRPIAASAPYTYFLPAQARLDAIGKDDLVQATIRSIPPSVKWDAERMWIKIRSASPEWLEGTLESTPSDMPKLPTGSVIRLPRSHVINVIFADRKKESAISDEPRRDYWERCLVDQCVLDGDLPVSYLYRETPDIGEDGDKYPDSGWRIRGDMRGVPEEQLDARKTAYVALGAVLNKDDSWIGLIDEPTGSAFEKDFGSGTFVRLD